MYHFGQKIVRADLTAEVLNIHPEVDKPVEVYGGHHVEGKLFLYIELEEFGPFDQSHLDRGEVGAFVLYKMRQSPE